MSWAMADSALTLPMNQNVPFANLARGGCRTNRNSLIAIGLREIGFVSYFSPCASV